MNAERPFPRRLLLRSLAVAGATGLLGRAWPGVGPTPALGAGPKPSAAVKATTPTAVALDQLTAAAFAPLVGRTFLVHLGPTTTTVTLIEARELPFAAVRPTARPTRHPFLLTFQGTVRTRFPQQTYAVENPATGVLNLFLVPVGTTRPLPLYEAVFN